MTLSCSLIDEVPYIGKYVCLVYNWLGEMEIFFQILFLVVLAYVIYRLILR